MKPTNKIRCKNPDCIIYCPFCGHTFVSEEDEQGLHFYCWNCRNHATKDDAYEEFTFDFEVLGVQ
jgi:aspartate carbamoyltransferase regulatory subunit